MRTLIDANVYLTGFIVVLAEEDLDAALGYKCLKIEVLMFQ